MDLTGYVQVIFLVHLKLIKLIKFHIVTAQTQANVRVFTINLLMQ